MNDKSIVKSLPVKDLEKALNDAPPGSIHDFFEVYRNEYPYQNVITASITFVLFLAFLLQGSMAALATSTILLGICAFSVIKIWNHSTSDKQYVQRAEMMEIVAKAYASKIKAEK